MCFTAWRPAISTTRRSSFEPARDRQARDARRPDVVRPLGGMLAAAEMVEWLTYRELGRRSPRYIRASRERCGTTPARERAALQHYAPERNGGEINAWFGATCSASPLSRTRRAPVVAVQVAHLAAGVL